MHGAKLGQYVQGDTFVHKLDPRTKLWSCLVLTLTVLMQPDTLVVAADVVLLALGFRLAQIRITRLLRRLQSLWLLLSLSFLFQAVLTDGDPLFTAFGLSVTMEGIARGGLTILRLLVLLFASSLLTMTTSPVKLAAGLEKLLSPFSRLGLPVAKLALLISVSLRFIPLMNEEAELVAKAQLSRGAPLRSKRWGARFKGMAAVLLPLVASSLQRAGDLALAMESRCYWGGAQLSRVKGLRYKREDRLAFGLLLLLIELSFCRLYK